VSGAGRLQRWPEAGGEPATLSTLGAWRRTGLAMSVAGLLAVLVGLVLAVRTTGVPQVTGAVLTVAGAIGVLLGSSFLRRSWSDPLVAGDPQVGRLRSWGGAAWTGWCAAILLRFVARLLPDGFDWLRWVGWALAAVSVAAYVGLLVLVARWRPGRV
jgi:hypothetical protein